MPTFLMLRAGEPGPTARLIRASAKTRTTVVLDLEDALWDVADPAVTSALKAAGRENLVVLAAEHAELFERLPIGVRVNSISGPEGLRDFEALGRACRFVRLECIVLPKLETVGELTACFAAVRANGLSCRTIIPIVETRRGLDNLGSLLEGMRSAGVERVVYGHYDLALDFGWWPFPEHDQPAFWDLVEPFVTRVEAAGLDYVHPPYFHTHDDAGLGRIFEHLSRSCSRDFGFLAIGLHQAATACRIRGGWAPPAAARHPSSDDPLRLARSVVEAYETDHKAGAGFALNPRSGEFIPPHLYVAALGFLGRAQHD